MTTTNALSRADLLDPVFTIEHVAALFHVSVDTAREYTYRRDFPAAHLFGARLLWDTRRLTWFRALPRGQAERARDPWTPWLRTPRTSRKPPRQSATSTGAAPQGPRHDRPTQAGRPRYLEWG